MLISIRVRLLCRLLCPLLSGLLASSLLAGLSGCSDSSDSGNSARQPQLRQVASASELETYLKDGLKHISQNSQYYLSDRLALESEIPLDDVATGESATAAPDSAGSGAENAAVQFSSTNVIEQGVDEADLLKFDGTDIYLVESYAQYPGEVITPVLASSETAPSATAAASDAINLRILRPDPSSVNVAEIALYPLPTTYFSPDNVEGLYLYQKDAMKQVAVIAQRYVYDTRPDVDVWGWCGMWSEGKTDIYFLDTSNPAAINATVQMEIDGYLMQSRRIDNNLYLVTRYTPSTPYSNQVVSSMDIAASGSNTGSNAANNTTSNAEINAAINALTLDELLPKISINGVSQTLVDPASCYVDSNEQGYPTMMVVTTINLDHPEQISSSCVTANTDGMYMAQKALYLYQTGWALALDGIKTQIYKFALDDNGTTYSASGNVAGYPAVPYFSLSEYAGILRVLTTTGSWNAAKHQLFTLQQQEDELETVASLPNDEHPELIGKINEMIQAVRFVGDKAYVVTFLQTDPLYVIDVADAANPFIAGQLEIPGFSTMLQPLDANTLLGFGFEDNQFKLELYDVSNPGQPASVAKVLLPGSSEATWNYKAIAIVNDENAGEVNIAVPYNEWDETGSITGAQMFTVNSVDKTLQNKGLMQVSDGSSTDGSSSDFYALAPRILLLNDYVHYTSGIDVWSGLFGVNGVGIQQ